MDCFCLNDLESVFKVSNSFCNASCPGNPTQTCGGENATLLSLYDTCKI